ncbi:restriction endonuclease subunit S [Halomonas sp. HG01]|uniref:restriction endonuclease subunit S n=1 Tax=Halomonas sp. HG01 TaxID=1609967 RepID=UPI0006144F94|nr:restriction endonuclease subunit S [Halomonas sp. HG01]
MSEWKTLQLGDHAEVLSGFPFPSEGFSQEEGVPLIRIRDLLAGELGTYFIGPYPEEFVINDSDILIGMDGDFNIVRWAKGKALLNQRVCKVFTSTDELDDGYLFWLLDPELQDIHQKTPQTTVKHLSVRDLAQLRLEVPPVNEQRLIARILDTLDTQIQKTEALIAKLEKVKEGMLHDLLTRGIDENGQLRPSPEQAPELYKESPLGLIPREWVCREIASIASTYAGGTPSRNAPGFFGGEILWIKSTEVNQESISSTEERITEQGLRKSSAKWVPAGTPLIAMYGATAGMVSWLTIRATTNQAVLSVAPNEEQCGRWVYWALTWSSPRLIASVQGSGQPNLSKGTIDALTMSVPKQSEQVAIANILDQHMTRLSDEKKHLMKIKAQKTGLMDGLLTGRVRVTPLLEKDQATTPA